MNLKYNILFFAFAISFIHMTCDNQQEIISSSYRSIPVTVEDFSDINSIHIGGMKLISLSSEEEFLFREIGKILFCDGLIFIKPWSQDKILVFSETGEGVQVIDFVGKGKGEYVSISDFDIDIIRKELIIIDPGNRKVLTYAFDGTFHKDFQFKEHIKLFKTIYCADSAVAYATDVGYSNINSDLSESFSFLLLNEDFKIIKSYFPFELPRGGFNGELSKIFSHNTTVSGYYKTFSNLIYHIECTGMRRQYQLDFSHPVIDYPAFENLMSGVVDMDHFDYVLDVTYFESQNNLIVGYTYKREKYLYMYDKVGMTGENFKIESKGHCRARNRFPLLSLLGNSLVFEISADTPLCMDILNDAPGSQDVVHQLENMKENQNPSLLIANIDN